jgi:DNA repair protein RadC
VVLHLSGSNSIKSLALSERPREKALALGVKQLTSKELLAIIIGSGVKGQSALAIAESILNQYGGLIPLTRISIHQWMEIDGINKVKALQLMTLFELFQRLEKEDLPKVKLIEPSQVFQYYRLRLGSLNQEQLLIIKLNHHLEYQGETLFRLGSQANIYLDFRDLFVDLLKTDTIKFLLLHNHPTGDVTPSQEDVSTTIHIKHEAKKLGFKLVDHIIMSPTKYFSMKQAKII